MASMTVVATLTVIQCGQCGIDFAVPQGWCDDRRRDHKDFYCPNGHSRCYPQETEEERLRKQLTNAQDRLTYAENRATSAARRAEHMERSRRAVKGQLTKERKRIAGGVCPCCNRTFVSLGAHMKKQHPDYVEQAVAGDA